MAKRFTDTSKWGDVWFSELSTEHKLIYIYILDNCDQVGVWQPNFKLAEFQLNIAPNWSLFKEKMTDKRLFVMPNGNWWLVKFCTFQYGEIDEKSQSKTTQFYIKLLKKHTLWIPYTEGIYTPKEKEKEKDSVLYKNDNQQNLILPENEVIERLKVNQYQDKEKMMRTYGFTETEYEHAVDMFCLEPENIEKDISEVIRHFKKWCGTKVLAIKQTAEDKLLNNHQREEIKKRNTNLPVGHTDKLFGG